MDMDGPAVSPVSRADAPITAALIAGRLVCVVPPQKQRTAGPWVRLARSCAWGALLLTAPPTFAADANQELEAIRAALVAAVREAPTRVISSAWIDEQGVLREEAFFHSSAQVRGVRVLSYLEEGADRPSLKATAQIALPAHVLTIARPAPPGLENPSTPTACRAPQAALFRHPVSLTLAAQTGARRDDAAVLGLLARATQAWWLRETPRASRWHPQGQVEAGFLQAQEGPPILAADSEQGYRRALLGPVNSPTTWGMRLHLTAPAEPSQPWQIRLTLANASDATEILSESRSIQPPHSPERFAGLSVLISLQEVLTQWIAKVDARLACEPPLLEVRPAAGSEWSVAAGQASGLKVGQRMLLLDRAKVPARWAEPDGLAEMGIAEVATVHARHATLRWLAGPRQQATGPWVALPL
jgi:hypothetical protein